MLAKRIFDLALAIPGLIVLSPILLAIALWIRRDSDGPIFFRQTRVGRHGAHFRIFKFRTMVANAEAIGPKITAGRDPRITPSGAFLRKTKLDELPQLLNVVAGDMSLVGPRPEVPEYVAVYPEALRAEILSVPPGITDFASIEFSDEARLLDGAADHRKVYVEEILPVKLAYQARYVRERGLWLDTVLILRTLAKIIRRG